MLSEKCGRHKFAPLRLFYYLSLAVHRLKDLLARQTQVRRILTYADGLAIGFFRRHGFTECTTLPDSCYLDRIGKYDKAVLHECLIHPDIPYATLPFVIRASREEIVRKWIHKDSACDPSAPMLREQQQRDIAAEISKGLAEEVARELGVLISDPVGADFGGKVGIRLQPLKLGKEQLLMSSRRESLASNLGMVGTSRDSSALRWVRERMACEYYTDLPQALADVVRLCDEAPLLSVPGSKLRAAFSTP